MADTNPAQKPGTYRIRTIDDFLAVPEDEMDACLADFRVFLENARKAARSCNARVRWLLREYDEATQDEFIGGMSICVVTRFLYRSKNPRKPRASSQGPGLPAPSEVRNKLNLRGKLR